MLAHRLFMTSGGGASEFGERLGRRKSERAQFGRWTTIGAPTLSQVSALWRLRQPLGARPLATRNSQLDCFPKLSPGVFAIARPNACHCFLPLCCFGSDRDDWRLGRQAAKTILKHLNRRRIIQENVDGCVVLVVRRSSLQPPHRPLAPTSHPNQSPNLIQIGFHHHHCRHWLPSSSSCERAPSEHPPRANSISRRGPIGTEATLGIFLRIGLGVGRSREQSGRQRKWQVRRA